MVKRATKKTDAFGALAIALALAGCGESKPAESPVGMSSVPAPNDGKPVAFAFDSLDARPLSSLTTRGKPTVLAFVTTYDLQSQAVMNFLVAMAKHDLPKGTVNYGLVALQERADRELVEVYKTNLGVTFPAALADAETMAGGGPFGEVRIPTVVILDKEGRIVWRKTGLSKSEEIRAGMRDLH